MSMAEDDKKTADELLTTLTGINIHFGHQFTQPLMNARKAIANALGTVRDSMRTEAATLEAEVTRLKELLTASEMFREAYQKGKMKLYSMEGEVAKAAMEHLPCSEGPLKRAAAHAVGHRLGWVTQKVADELYAEVVAAREENAALKAKIEELKKRECSHGPYKVWGSDDCPNCHSEPNCGRITLYFLGPCLSCEHKKEVGDKL